MIHRLPKWVWLGAALLAIIAGMVDAISLLGVYHVGVSHLTGNSSSLGIDLAQARWGLVGRMGLLITLFVGGAAVSGVVVRDASLQLGRRYGVALMMEAALLISAMALLTRGLGGGVYFLAMACGLQNAMVSTFSGEIVRTTHVTGIFTDIGLVLGHALRGAALQKKKLSLLLVIAGGFIAGAALGAWLFTRIGYAALGTPAVATGLIGVAYFLIQQRRGRAMQRETYVG